MKSAKIILFGATGLVGSRITDLLSEKIEILAPTRLEVDLTSTENIKKYLDRKRADYIVYAAGITRQDQAEEEKELALILNSKAPEMIAKIANEELIPLIYFSTDAVFDGKKSNSSYLETDKINPVNYYGITKAKGEEAILSASNKNLVIRLISVYTGKFTKKSDFARRGLEKISKGEIYESISDLYFNPTYVDDAVEGFLSSIEKQISGILHIGSSETISNYDFMIDLVDALNFDRKLVRKVAFKDFFNNNSAKRGQYTWLDVTKAQTLLGGGVINSNKINIQKFKVMYES